MRKTLKRVLATFAAATMAFALTATAVPSVSAETDKAAKKAAKADFDPDGTYHAYFGFQETDTWIFRDEWYSDTLGLNGTNLKDAGFDYTGGTLFQSANNELSTVDGTSVQDAEITGNGTYTVGVSNINGALEGGSEAKVSMIYVTTDIPWTAADGNPVTISDWKLTVDGKDVSLPSDIFYPSEYIDEAGFIRFDPINTYQKDQSEYEDCPDLLGFPADSIQITFTVSGFNSDNADASGGTDDAAAAGGDTATSGAGTSSSSGGGSPIVPIVIVVIIVVVVVVVVKKRQS